MFMASSGTSKSWILVEKLLTFLGLFYIERIARQEVMLLLTAGIKQLGNLSQTCFVESSFTVTNGKFCVVTSDKIYTTSYSQITRFWLPQHPFYWAFFKDRKKRRECSRFQHLFGWNLRRHGGTRTECTDPNDNSLLSSAVDFNSNCGLRLGNFCRSWWMQEPRCRYI